MNRTTRNTLAVVALALAISWAAQAPALRLPALAAALIVTVGCWLAYRDVKRNPPTDH